MSRELIGSVLLVEDSEATVNYNKRLLQKNKVSENIIVAYNGEEAIKQISNMNEDSFPELILLDLNMPKLGGFGFLTEYEQLFSEERRKNTLIVLLSTSILDSDVLKAKEFKAPPLFLTKPLTKEKLEMIAESYYSINKTD